MTDTPLNDREMELLESFLMEHFESDNSMPLDMAHGYLTTVLSGPGLIMPGEWLPHVLGDAEFSDQQQAEQVMSLLMRLYNSILDELNRRDYGPLLIYQTEAVSEPLPLPFGWCEGYLRGWELHGEGALDRMLGDEDAEPMLAPIMVFLMYEEEHLLNPPDEQMHRNTVDEIGNSVQNIFDWWFERRETPAGGVQ
jgi:uncharacterized protein